MFRFKEAALERAGDTITIECNVFDILSIQNEIRRSIIFSEERLEAYKAKVGPSPNFGQQEMIQLIEVNISDSHKNYNEFQRIADMREKLIEEKEEAANA